MSLPLAGRVRSAARPLAPPRHRGTATGRNVGLKATCAAAATTLAFLAIAALFLISPHLLYRWGFTYESTGGSFAEKMHPGTWLAFAALIFWGLRRRSPLHTVDAALARHGGLAVFLLTWVLLLLYTIVVRHVPFTPLIDTFALPIALFLVLVDLSPVAKQRLALLLHLIMLANALLGLFEFETGFRLTPYVEEGVEITSDWRSTALLGHPLVNAGITGAYVLVLAVGGGRDVPALLRPVLLVIQCAAMVAFGGRAALVFLLPLLAFIALTELARIARGRRVKLLHAALFAIVLPGAVAVTIGLIEAGFFDRLADRFVEDRGSAQARVVILKLLQEIPLEDLILGSDQARVATIQHLEGIEFGIESFWVNFSLLYGLGISLFFFFGLFCFCHDLVKATRTGAWVVLAFLFAIATTSVSLSAKTAQLGMIVALLMTMLRKDGTYPQARSI
ncbi:MAG: VpsF family polysaccharide biosynthesis protein [Methylobacteriaceae bacterium]|nr:VpsF family polysaccharide biosynthesis protein [Methylobacteriaceae bacterium]